MGLRYVIGGGNIATESVLPESWNWDAMDADNLHAINDKVWQWEVDAV